MIGVESELLSSKPLGRDQILKDKKMRKFQLLCVLILVLCMSCNPDFQSSTHSDSLSPSLIGTNQATQAPNEVLTLKPPTPTYSGFKETSHALRATAQTAVAGTLEAWNVTCEEGYRLEDENVVIWFRQLDFTWIVYTCSPSTQPYNRRYTTVKDVEQTKNWIIPHDSFKWSSSANMYLRPYRLSQELKYLYLVPDYYGPPGGGFYPPGYFVDESALYRIDLDTGQFETILHESDNYAVEISPDDKYLAYSPVQKNITIYIMDLSTKSEREISIGDEYMNAGGFVWTPDSSTVIFAGGIENWFEGDKGISIFSLSIRDMHLQLIVYNDLRQLVPAWECIYEYDDHWIDNFTLRLDSLDEDYWNYEWSIDIQSGEIFQAQLSPSS
jgi:hypothetical protein